MVWRETNVLSARLVVIASTEIGSAFAARAWPLVSCLTALLVALPAAANDAVRFQYDAPAECPDAAAFSARVRERSQHGRFATDGELARTFVVTITVETGGATGRVDFVDADGSHVFRKVRADTCEDAVSGIALVTALAIDGRALPEETPATVPVADPPAAAAAPAPGAHEVVERPPPPPPPPPRAPEREQRHDSTLSFSAGAGAGYASHKGPSGAPTLDIFAGARLSDYSPSARVSAWHFWTQATSEGRRARFRGFGLRLEACPLALGSAPWFFEPCLATDVGVLLASGVASAALAEPRESTRAWWDAVALARAGTVVGGWLSLEVQGELAASFAADRYGFGEPPADSDVFDVPRLGISARGGAGFRFW